jgi:hypothetical protein
MLKDGPVNPNFLETPPDDSVPVPLAVDAAAADEWQERPSFATKLRTGALPLTGALLVAIGLFVLYANEGRVNPVDLPDSAIPLKSDDAPPWGADGQLVAVNGVARADSLVGDNIFVEPGPYLQLRREMEVYSWHERQEYDSVTDERGLTQRIPKNVYTQRWNANPHNSLAFAEPEGHINPEPHFEKGTYRPAGLTVGDYLVNTSRVALRLPDEVRLNLEDQTLNLWNERDHKNRATLHDNYLYMDGADPSAPEIGDVRLSYYYVPEGRESTVYGRLEGYEIRPYAGLLGDRLFRLEDGVIDPIVFESRDLFARETRLNWIVGLAASLAGFMLIGLAIGGGFMQHLQVAFVAALLAAAGTATATVAFKMAHELWTWGGMTMFLLVISMTVFRSIGRTKARRNA